MMTDVETRDRLYIDGDWTPASGPGFEVVSPVTEKPVAHLSAAGRGLVVAARIRTGTLGINQGYSMDPAACFGGVKNSGYGRELGPEGIDAYLTTKSISGL